MGDRGDFLKIVEIVFEALDGSGEFRVLRTARAAGTIPVFGDLDTDAESAKMRDLAEKIHGRLGVAVFQFAIGWAHAAKGADLAVRADGFAPGRSGADLLQRPVPTLAEAAIAKIETILMGENADGHFAVGIDGAAVVPAAAGVAFGRQGNVGEGALVFEEAEIFVHARGITELERNGLFRSEPDI